MSYKAKSTIDCIKELFQKVGYDVFAWKKRRKKKWRSQKPEYPERVVLWDNNILAPSLSQVLVAMALLLRVFLLLLSPHYNYDKSSKVTNTSVTTTKSQNGEWELFGYMCLRDRMLAKYSWGDLTRTMQLIAFFNNSCAIVSTMFPYTQVSSALLTCLQKRNLKPLSQIKLAFSHSLF